jgi:hypothetical protein
LWLVDFDDEFGAGGVSFSLESTTFYSFIQELSQESAEDSKVSSYHSFGSFLVL